MARGSFVFAVLMALPFAGCDQPPPATDEIVEPDEIDELEAGETSVQGTEPGEGEGADRRVQRRESAVDRETSVR